MISIERGYNGKNADNFIRIITRHTIVYFSYDTIVAFYTEQSGFVICENVWGTTTGKHLDYIDPDHSIRLSYDDFQKELTEHLGDL